MLSALTLNENEDDDDDEADLQNPHRPFYVSGDTAAEQLEKAQERCDEDDLKAKPHPDVTGRLYWTCEEDETDD